VREYEHTLKACAKTSTWASVRHCWCCWPCCGSVLTWGLQALRRLSQELDEIEGGTRESLSEQHPRELLRLTGSLNRLLQANVSSAAVIATP
jgi:two-component system sensor histidine kinase PhoQ